MYQSIFQRRSEPSQYAARAFGADETQALMQAVGSLETALPFYIDERKPLPPASKARRGRRCVRPSALASAKLGVYQATSEQGIKKAELARRLGWHAPQVDRLSDLRHASRVDQIEAAAGVRAGSWRCASPEPRFNAVSGLGGGASARSAHAARVRHHPPTFRPIHVLKNAADQAFRCD